MAGCVEGARARRRTCTPVPGPGPPLCANSSYYHMRIAKIKQCTVQHAGCSWCGCACIQTMMPGVPATLCHDGRMQTTAEGLGAAAPLGWHVAGASRPCTLDAQNHQPACQSPTTLDRQEGCKLAAMPCHAGWHHGDTPSYPHNKKTQPGLPPPSFPTSYKNLHKLLLLACTPGAVHRRRRCWSGKLQS